MNLKPVYVGVLWSCRANAAGFFRYFAGAIRNQAYFSTLSSDYPETNTDDSTAQSSSLEDASTASPQAVHDQTLDMDSLKDGMVGLNKYGTNSDTRFLRQEATIDNIDAALIDMGKRVHRFTTTAEDFEKELQTAQPKNVGRLVKPNIVLQDQQANARAARAQLRQRDKDSLQEAFLDMVASGCTREVQILLSEGAEVELQDSSGQTPLLIAAMNGHIDVVNVLLAWGSSMQTLYRHQRTILMVASENGHLEIAQALIARGEIIDARDVSRRTALMLAAENGHQKVVDVLLSNGASADASDDKGHTPIMLASEKGFLETVQTLILSGASINVRDVHQRTALMLASSNGHLYTIKIGTDRQSAVVQALLASGASVDAQDESEETSLMMASRNGYWATMKALVRRGANIDAQNSSGYTPLILATINDKATAVEVLIRLGANISVRDKKGEPAGVHSCRLSTTRILSLLESAGS